MSSEAGARDVVLVHGGFVDGSGWRGVYDAAHRGRLPVTVVQNPTLSLEDDAAATQAYPRPPDGPAILVGHSYGGAVITEAGLHDSVAGLVYIAAFAPDQGESVSTLLAGLPPTGRRRRSCRPRRLPVPRPREFDAAFAADCPRRRRSWPTRRSPGGWTRSTGRSANPPGAASRAGIWLRLMTG